MLLHHQAIEILPGLKVCPCPSCCAEFFRALGRSADAGATPAMLARAARLQAVLIEQAKTTAILRQTGNGVAQAQSD
ncbi:hypothetical protein [Geminicoccus flavidas]|uniref:hypothetical protein n=1 Tax=Geminicoccus flavidas TaxID=2506407 RepID=UPI001356E9A3|nr:hypothetical protein [Geminicoccus flavidas]